MKQAGAKVVSQLAYNWDHYIRLIKGYFTSKENKIETVVYTDENMEAAKTLISDILKELEGCRYIWQNLTREGMASLEQEKKEIEEEEVFVKLLNNILKTQTEKLLRSRK